MILQAKDGGVGHAIAIVGDWIFDSSKRHALPLTMESLDWCCMDGFYKVFRAIQFLPKK